MVTGAGGVLGQKIVQAVLDVLVPSRLVLASRKKPVNCFGNDMPSEFFQLDLTHAPQVPDGVDTIIHAAGEKYNPVNMEAVNHYGTRQFAREAARRGVRRFIHISSVGVYGAPLSHKEVTEKDTQSPRNRYERSKARGEAAVLAVGQETGMEVIVLQPATVLSVVPGVHFPLLGLAQSVKLGRFAWLRGYDPMTNFICVADVAAAVAYVTAMSGNARGTYILNTPLPLRQLVGHIASLLNVPMPQRRLPALPVRLAGLAGDALQAVTGRALPINSAKLSQLMCVTRFAPERLLETGFDYPLGIEKSVAGLLTDYRKKGFL